MAWDTQGLFQGLLDTLPDLLSKARSLRTTNPEEPITLKAAVVGFALFYPMTAWSKDNFLFIEEHLRGEPSLDTFSPSEGCREAITVFACLGLGALLGKFNAGEIDNDGAVLGEWHLMTFTSVHGTEICSGYSATMKT